MQKLKAMVQYLLGGCTILLALMIAGVGGGVLSALLMFLSGFIILPPVIRRIPRFQYRKVVLIILALLFWTVGIVIADIPESEHTESAAVSASSVSTFSSESVETEAKQVELKTASKAATEQAEKEVAVASKQVEQDEAAKKEKTTKYWNLIMSNYSKSNYDNIDYDDKKALKKVIDNNDLEFFTEVWRKLVKSQFENAYDYMRQDDVFNDAVAFYLYFYKDRAPQYISKELEVYKDRVEAIDFYNAFQKTYKGYIETTTNYPGLTLETFRVINVVDVSYNNKILDAFASSSNVYYYATSMNDGSEVALVSDGSISFPQAGIYQVYYLNTGKTITAQDTAGFKREIPKYYLFNYDEFDKNYEKMIAVDYSLADYSSMIGELIDTYKVS